MRILLALTLCLTLPLTAFAQETDSGQTERDRSYLTGLIEDNLSGAGRSVILDGFKGALSSRATFDTLTIADDSGVWLTIRDGAMAWSRSALLTGNIKIDELSAKEIDLARLPGSSSDGTPSPEAKPFALPELPVSVNIGKVKADKLSLGAPVLGQAVVLKLEGSMSLAGGSGKAVLAVDRIDGKRGKVSLNGEFANTTRQLTLDLLVDEGAEGIAATLMNLPGAPALTLSAAGAGPIDDFKADIALSSDNRPRIKGQIELKSQPQQGFAANLSGDVSPLLPPEYRSFFGTHAAVIAEGRQQKSGGMSLTKLEIESDALAVSGAADLMPNGMPDKFDLTAKIGLASGEPVVLPISGPKTTLRQGSLTLTYDRAKSDGWTLNAGLDDVSRAGVAGLERLSILGSGRINQVGDQPTVGGTLRFAASGIDMSDPALGDAIGPSMKGGTIFYWQGEQPLRLQNLSLNARDFDLSGGLTVTDPTGGIDISGKVTAQHRTLADLAALAGRDLSGSADAVIEGSYTVLSGAFDGTAAVNGQDIKIGIAEVDGLLAGASQIAVSAKRDETGLTLRSLNATARALSAEASGLLATGKSDITAKASLRDLSVLGRGYRGALDVSGKFTETGETQHISADATGGDLAIGMAEVDRLLAGQSRVSASADLTDGVVRLRNLDLKTPQLTAKATGDAAGKVTLEARLANAALFAPGFDGPLTVRGDVTQAPSSYGLDLAANGPGGTEAKVKGSVASDFGTVDLTIGGRAEAALANGFIAPRAVSGPVSFDLAMKGAPGLPALSGKLSAHGARLVAPTLGQSLDNINADATLSDGRLNVVTDARLRSGGGLTIRGPVTLSAPYPVDLAITLDQARLRDPSLYDTTINGQLALKGPVTAGGMLTGALTLGRTELRVPSSGLGGASAIPEMEHRNEPAKVHQTRVRAGLAGAAAESKGASGPGIGLDVTVSAPSQIFVRGRGVDAELGGSVRFTGTTSNVVPIGEFNLVRGRLDILAKRFNLTEGKVAMQGALVPWVSFAATTSQSDATITLSLEGDATEPALHLTSSPDLPEEEILSRLLFNKGLENISAVQAAQLASAVATLAGKGGEGIIGTLRQNFGLDDLDVGTDETGNTTVRAGKYLSENVYTNLAVDSEGKTAVELNLDVMKNVTARGAVDSEGSSSLGVYYERDY